MGRLRDILRSLAAVAGTAMVMASWSELVFYNGDLADTLAGRALSDPLGAVMHLGGIWAFYCIPGAVLVGLVATFGATGSTRVMLIGALVGFVIEGAVVPAVYEAPPFSFLWTAIAWHGPITIGLGGFLVPWLLARMSWLPMLAAAGVLGGLWGLWMPWTWIGESEVRLDAVAFGAFAASTFIMMAAGYILMGLARWPDVWWPRPVTLLVGLGTAVLFLLQAAISPLWGMGLALLLVVLLLGLRWIGPGRSPHHRPKTSNLVALWILPASATLVYALALRNGPFVSPEELPGLAFFGGLVIWLVLVFRGVVARGRAT